ncbi:MAG: cation:proton antiporter subunit C [Candidatus Eutrophobiaceae bacterium]
MSYLINLHYVTVVAVMMTGIYVLITHTHLVKKLIGLSIFQTSIFILFISLGKVYGGTAPVLAKGYESYASALPHVLILTAIVVGIATTALGLSLVARIHGAFGTVEEDEIDRALAESEVTRTTDQEK